MTAATPCCEVDELTGAVCSLPCTHPKGVEGAKHWDRHDTGLWIAWPVMNVS